MAAGLTWSKMADWRASFSSAYPVKPSMRATRTSWALETRNSSATSPMERKEASRMLESR